MVDADAASAPKTKRGSRVIPLDERTVALLLTHWQRQERDRACWGEAWNGGGLVFTCEDGSTDEPADLSTSKGAADASAGQRPGESMSGTSALGGV